MNFNFEMNPIGLDQPVIEYVPAGIQGEWWYNTGSATHDMFNLRHGTNTNNPDAVVHYWTREVYSNKSYILVQGGQEEIDLGTWADFREQIRGDALQPFTFAMKFSNIYADYLGTGRVSFGQMLWELTNAEFVYSGCNGVTTVDSTIPGSIRHSDMVRSIMTIDPGNESFYIDSGFQFNSPWHDGIGMFYLAEGPAYTPENEVIVWTWEPGRTGSTIMWRNGVRVPVDGDILTDFTDADTGPDPTVNAPQDLIDRDTVAQINYEYMGAEGPVRNWWGDPFNDLYWPSNYSPTYGDTCSPENMDIDAHYIIMENQLSTSTAAPTDGENGLTHFRFYRQTPTDADVQRLIQEWS